MTTTTNTFRANADGRTAWMHDLAAPIHAYLADNGTNPPDDHPIWVTYIDRVVTEGPRMGRTAAWQSAVAWFSDPSITQHRASWVALQGSVHLAYANV